MDRKVKVSVVQPCLTFCDLLDCTLPSTSVPEILQARMLEWVAIPFSRGSSQPTDLTPSLLHCWQILYYLSHQRSPTMAMRPLLWTLSSSEKNKDSSLLIKFGPSSKSSPCSLHPYWFMFIGYVFQGMIPLCPQKIPEHAGGRPERLLASQGQLSVADCDLWTESLVTDCPSGVSLA